VLVKRVGVLLRVADAAQTEGFGTSAPLRAGAAPIPPREVDLTGAGR